MSNASQIMPIYVPTYVSVQMMTPFCIDMTFILLPLNRSSGVILEPESHFKCKYDLGIFFMLEFILKNNHTTLFSNHFNNQRDMLSES